MYIGGSVPPIVDFNESEEKMSGGVLVGRQFPVERSSRVEHSAIAGTISIDLNIPISRV